MALTFIPTSGQTLAFTRDPIRNNFITIDTAFSVDHVDYNDPNQGKHNQVTMPVQASPPTTLGGEVALFSQIYSVSTIPEAWIIKQNNGFTIPITAGNLNQPGWSYLPSGLVLKWGQANTTATPGLTTITFPTSATIPVFTQIYSMQITEYATTTVAPFDSNIFVRLNSYFPTFFTVFGTSRTQFNVQVVAGFQYLALGRVI